MRYEIRRRVLDEFGNGIGGVRVEAWDRDLGLDDHLGSASTISDGSFTLVFHHGAFSDRSSSTGATTCCDSSSITEAPFQAAVNRCVRQ